MNQLRESATHQDPQVRMAAIEAIASLVSNAWAENVSRKMLPPATRTSDTGAGEGGLGDAVNEAQKNIIKGITLAVAAGKQVTFELQVYIDYPARRGREGGGGKRRMSGKLLWSTQK